ncbi:MAG TPA: hypothetical protein VKA19_14430 [Alphaproteobacteria bacterium]|nr:hypothetical protein [Alphaproteobacteria bacterium]
MLDTIIADLKAEAARLKKDLAHVEALIDHALHIKGADPAGTTLGGGGQQPPPPPGGSSAQ